MSGMFIFFYHCLAAPLGVIVVVMWFWSITGLLAWVFFNVPSGFHGFWVAGLLGLGAYVARLAWGALMTFLSRQHVRLRDRFEPGRDVSFFAGDK